MVASSGILCYIFLEVFGSVSRRIVKIPLKSVESVDIERFLELLTSSLKTRYSKARMEGGFLIVEIVGDRHSIRESLARIKRLVAEYSRDKKRRGVTRIQASRIHRDVGLAVPPDLLVEILKYQGYRASYIEGVVETDAPLDNVLQIAGGLAERLNELSRQPLATSARKAAAGASLLSGLPLSEILSIALEEGVFYSDSLSRAVARGGWKVALKNLLEILEKRYGGLGYDKD